MRWLLEALDMIHNQLGTKLLSAFNQAVELDRMDVAELLLQAIETLENNSDDIPSISAAYEELFVPYRTKYQ